MYGVSCYLHVMTILPLTFQFGNLIFCLIVVARTSDTMLKRSGETGHSCLVSEFSRKAFRFSSLSIVLALVFIMLRYAPSIPTLVRVWSWMDIEFCQCIYHLLRWSCSSCLLLVWYIKLIFACWTILVTLGWILLDHVVQYYPLLLDSVCWYFVKVFASILIKDIGI